ncbi:tetratricopeptide repeat protein [Chloroflexus sp.]|uniref:tetratricopeptide repeat protein n=1 Tax=Chloroflexus sp. TaxID=1904827 RepID=UPI00260CE136|nr:tetratricopeptide repeat protein [uncultured Chloroflexus sp.]
MRWSWRRGQVEPYIDQQTDRPKWYRRLHRWQWLLLMLALIGVVISLVVLLQPSEPRFVIAIAPFADQDGRTGQQIAGALARQLRAQGSNLIQVLSAETRPGSKADALVLAQQLNVDLLVWGEVTPGGVLDSASLRPHLIYTPRNLDITQAWHNFAPRFAMPQSFTISAAPINGQAVLIPYLLALTAYHHGEADLALDQFQRLLEVHPQLNPLLPQLLQGNLLWARGWYTAAATEYQAALATATEERALITNNLGAILFDARDPAAPNYFAEAIDLLDGRDLGQLRVNLALWALREQRTRDAVSDLEQARNLLPAHPELEIILATAYRESGRLSDAATALERAAQLKSMFLNRVPQAFRPAVETRLEALLFEERALVTFERLLPLSGPLYWSIEAAEPLPAADSVRQARDNLRTATEYMARSINFWRQRAASEAAIFPGAGLMSTGQAERSEELANRQRIELALIEATLQAATGNQASSSPNRWLAALFGATSADNTTVATLQQLREQLPDDVPLLLTLGFALRVDGQLDQAEQIYRQVIELAPQLPDGYVGVGKIAMSRNDQAGAQASWQMALERNQAFFPAHLALARLAESASDWSTAITHWRALTNWQETPYTIVNLSRVLRRSGVSGFAEAERLLVPLATTEAEAAIELARLYNDAGYPAEAAAVYRDALTLAPRSTVAAFELGETYLKLNDLTAAEQMLRQALSFDERNLDARMRLAELYEGPLNRPDRAVEQYRIALGQGIDDPDRLIMIGQAALNVDAATVAIQALERALNLRPESVTAQQLLARAYLAGNRVEAAAQTARRAIEQTANRADSEAIAARTNALLTMAEIARRRNDETAADEFYRQAIATDPRSVAAHIGLGELTAGQGNWGVALGYFETAVNLPGGETNPTAQFWLGEALLRNGQLARAMAAYQRALELQPQYPGALLGLAQTQYALGRADEALETVDQALRQESNFAEAHLFRGKLLQEAGRFNEARAAYDAAISANDRIAESFYRRALLAIRANDYDQAIRDLNRAIALQPNFPEAHYWLGRAYYAQGRTENASQAIRQAIALNADYSEAIFYSGLIAEDQANLLAAREAYQTLISREPTSEWGQRARAQLERLP